MESFYFTGRHALKRTVTVPFLRIRVRDDLNRHFRISMTATADFASSKLTQKRFPESSDHMQRKEWQDATKQHHI